MALSIPPQTNIILIGQAPNREPYKQLFDFLLDALEKNEITLSCVNTQAYGTMRLRDHAPSNTFALVTDSPAEMLNSHQDKYASTLAFGEIVPDESKIGSIEDLYVLSNNSTNPLIILLPWSHDPAWYIGDHGAQHASSFHAPCHDQDAIDIVKLAFPDAQIHNFIDAELTPEFEKLMRKLVLPANASNSSHEYNFPKNSDLQLKVSQLEKIIIGNTRKGLEHYRPATVAEYTEAEQALIDSLIDQRTALEAEVFKLKGVEGSLQASILNLAETKDARLEEVRAEAQRLHEQWDAKHKAAVVDTMRENGIIVAEITRQRKELQDAMEAYHELKEKFFPTIDTKILAVEEEISDLLEHFYKFAEIKSRTKVSDRKINSVRKSFIVALDILFDERCCTTLNVIRQKANPKISVYDMTLFALAQFGIIETDPRTNENLVIQNYRLTQDQIWHLLSQSALGASEDESHWFQQLTNSFPDYIKMQFRSAFTASRLPKDQKSWISGEDIWANLIATATDTLPLTAADEIEQAAIANGAHTKDALPVAQDEVIDVAEVNELRQLGE